MYIKSNCNCVSVLPELLHIVVVYGQDCPSVAHIAARMPVLFSAHWLCNGHCISSKGSWFVYSYCHRSLHHPYHTHTPPFSGPFPGLPGWASTRKVKPIWILLKQETVSGSGITWTICSRQITMPAPHHSVFYWPSCRPTNNVKALKASLSAAYLL